MDNKMLMMRSAIAFIFTMGLVAASNAQDRKGDPADCQRPGATAVIADGMRLCEYRGKYSDPILRYSFVIPKGLRVLGNVDGMPAQGVRVPIRAAGPDFISVSTTFTEFDSSDDWLGSGLQAQVLQKGTVRIGGLAAKRVLMKLYDAQTGRVRYADVVTYDLKEGQLDRRFRVCLYTSPEHLRKDRALFSRVIHSWRIHPEEVRYTNR